MKKRLFKRTISFLLVSIMLLASATTAFAEEQPKLGIETEELCTALSTDMEVINISVGDMGIEPMSNQKVFATVPANGTNNLYPKLESYVGLSKTFFVNATSPSSKAGLFLYLYDPDGKLVSHDWVMGTNEAARWSVFLPKSGIWRLYVVGHATEEYVDVWAGWE